MSGIRTNFGIGVFLFIVAAPSPGSVAQDPSAPDEQPAALPQARIAPPDGFDDQDAFEKWVQEELGKLATEAQKSEPPIDRASKFLTAANHLLSYGVVSEATREVLGVPDAPGSAAQSLAVHVRVKSLLSEAEASLRTSGADDVVVSRLRLKLGTLQAFSTALRVALTTEGSSEEVRRSAASALAPLSEDADESIVAAASLWQAVLRSREADLAPAFSILPMATADPRDGRGSYEFFGKLLRCRLLGRESPAAAAAMLLQIEEQCHQWFEGARERALAIRATAWVRLNVLAAWCDKLDRPETLSSCRQSVEALIAEHFATETSILPLSPTVPAPPAVPDGAAGSDSHEPDDHGGE